MSIVKVLVQNLVRTAEECAKECRKSDNKIIRGSRTLTKAVLAAGESFKRELKSGNKVSVNS